MCVCTYIIMYYCITRKSITLECVLVVAAMATQEVEVVGIGLSVNGQLW